MALLQKKGAEKKEGLAFEGHPRAEQNVRFARFNILFYDQHVRGLYHRNCALYRLGVKIQK